MRIIEERPEVLQADELRFQAEGVLQLEGIPDRLAGRPEEEDEGDGDLRREQGIGQPCRAENNAFLHPDRRTRETDFLLVGRLELAQDDVAALDGVVHRRLGGLLALQDGFHLLLENFAALHEAAEAQALGIGRRPLLFNWWMATSTPGFFS